MRYSLKIIPACFMAMIFFHGCSEKTASTPAVPSSPAASAAAESKPAKEADLLQAPVIPDRPFRVVHVIVALCDNQHQGIARVPAELGDGQQPRTNLYWGAMYGLKTFFGKSEQWTRLAAWTPKDKAILEGVIYRYKPASGKTVYLIAEAWDGAKMPEAMKAFSTTPRARTAAPWSFTR